jgi:hypothetical protein
MRNGEKLDLRKMGHMNQGGKKQKMKSGVKLIDELKK